jgi:hypothetical protein
LLSGARPRGALGPGERTDQIGQVNELHQQPSGANIDAQEPMNVLHGELTPIASPFTARRSPDCKFTNVVFFSTSFFCFRTENLLANPGWFSLPAERAESQTIVANARSLFCQNIAVLFYIFTIIGFAVRDTDGTAAGWRGENVDRAPNAFPGWRVYLL